MHALMADSIVLREQICQINSIHQKRETIQHEFKVAAVLCWFHYYKSDIRDFINQLARCSLRS